MTGELEKVLAQLAGELGTTTGELWAWLRGDGLAAYAAVRVAKLGCLG